MEIHGDEETQMNVLERKEMERTEWGMERWRMEGFSPFPIDIPFLCCLPSPLSHHSNLCSQQLKQKEVNNNLILTADEYNDRMYVATMEGVFVYSFPRPQRVLHFLDQRRLPDCHVLMTRPPTYRNDWKERGSTCTTQLSRPRCGSVRSIKPRYMTAE